MGKLQVSLSAVPRPRPRKSGEGIDFITCRHCRRAFRAITYTHLVFAHHYDPEHPVEEYKRFANVSSSRSLDSLKRASRSINAHYERIGRHWSRDRIVRELRKRKSNGQPLNTRAVQMDDCRLALAALRKFGSWKKALLAAGMDDDKVRLQRRWSKEDVLRAVKTLYRSGYPMNDQSIRQRDLGLISAGIRRFGSWDETLRTAGIDPPKVRRTRKWTREKVLRAIRQLGGPRRTLEVAQTDPGLPWIAQKFFGTWRAANEAAGFRYLPRKSVQKWHPDKILKALRSRARRGLSVNLGATRSEFGGLQKAAGREFGGWLPALRAAGCLRYLKRRRKRWTREELLTFLRRLHETHGFVTVRLVNANQRKRYTQPLGAIRETFGSLREARRIAAARHFPSRRGRPRNRS